MMINLKKIEVKKLDYIKADIVGKKDEPGGIRHVLKFVYQSTSMVVGEFETLKAAQKAARKINKLFGLKYENRPVS